MQRKLLRRLTSVLIASTIAAALFLGGCDGDDGEPGAPGAPGRDAGEGPVNVGTLTPQEQAEVNFQGEVLGVTVSSPPVVRFRVTDGNGNPVLGLGQKNTAGTQLNNLKFSLAKLIPSAPGTPSRWVNYIVTTIPTATVPLAGARPTQDREGTLVDNLDGTYQYTFARDITLAASQVAALTDTGNFRKADLDDLTYNPNLTHRLLIEYGGSVFNTSPAIDIENPLNLVYDFVPATGLRVTSTGSQREIVTTENCNECHGKIGVTTPHNGRVDARYCAMCHTAQRAYGRAQSTSAPTTGIIPGTGSNYVVDGEVLGEFVTMVHKIHMGNRLNKTNYNYAGVEFDDLGYSQNAALCRKCHRGDTPEQLAKAPQANNWYTMPSRKACGSCHDNVNFATGANIEVPLDSAHIAQTNDALCANCHTGTDTRQKHALENLTPNNPDLPAGLANISYEIASGPTVDATTRALTVRFRILRDGQPVTFVAPAATVSAPLDGFTGSPSFLLAYALPQVGFNNTTTARPVDYNNRGRSQAQPQTVSIAALLSTSGTAGSLGTRDASGFYTATINNAFPVGATLRAVGLQGYFTQAVGTGGIAAATARHAVSVIRPVTGDTVRRTVVDPAKCGKCHEWFEAHGGNRVYETQLCVTCHNPNLTTSGRTITDAKLSAYAFTDLQEEILLGWDPEFDQATPGYALLFPEFTNNFKELIHGIHAGATRSDPLRNVRNGNAANITLLSGDHFVFPNLLKNCDACHLSAPAGTNRQTYKADLPANVLPTTNVTLNATTPATVTSILAARGTVPNPQDLVISPIVGACISCHDSPTAKAHMASNGAQLGAGLAGPSYTDLGVPRTELTFEQCALCHGEGRIADAVVVHAR